MDLWRIEATVTMRWPSPLARSTAAVFARWQEALAALLVWHGLTEERSRGLAAFTIAAVEAQ
ncbi:hypothetical protein [Streptomyces caeruleatus]|uniref:LmrA/YxaF family transcription factor n=1 Tax=Streptomyces caeruleatus TaxID=661399 RepID=UPI000B1F9769|nr:hypothetical protein [Streptomyces caeruleatus]